MHQGLANALGLEGRVLSDVSVNMAKLSEGVVSPLHHV
jgi:hypothetical protein